MPYPKVIVLCTNSEGAPEVTPEQLRQGEHYVLAKENAEFNGFTEPMIAFDAEDPAAKQLESLAGYVRRTPPSTSQAPGPEPAVSRRGASLGQFSYVPFQELITAARAIVAQEPEGMQKLESALGRVDSALEDQANCAEDIKRARELATDDLEIDDDPMVSVGDRGVWVNAWAWVPAPAEEPSGG
jgi:hypothetical protein